MNMSRAVTRRWVIDGVDERAVKYAKLLAGYRDERIAAIVEQAIYAYWDKETDEATFVEEWMSRRAL